MVRAAPGWLRDLGITSWLLVGVTLLLVGAVWLLSLTETIVMPVITAGVVAAVASPVVRWLSRGRLPRAAAAGLLMLSLVALAVGLVVLIVAGIASQASDLSGHLQSAQTHDPGLAAGPRDRREERGERDLGRRQLGDVGRPGAARRRRDGRQGAVVARRSSSR